MCPRYLAKSKNYTLTVRKLYQSVIDNKVQKFKVNMDYGNMHLAYTCVVSLR